MARSALSHRSRARQVALLTAFLDTNVIVRHLTGDPPAMARRATEFLRVAEELLLVDVVVAECVYVLESFYEAPRSQVAELIRAAVALPKIRVLDVDLLLRALEVYEHHGLHFADAYLVAAAELSGIASPSNGSHPAAIACRPRTNTPSIAG